MIYCIGGANIDLNIKLDSKARLKESNPATIKKSFGGVSRNIAKAISLYNTCKYISIVPDEEDYHNLIKDLSDSGIDTSLVKFIKGKTSLYVDFIDDNGLLIGASDMSAVEEINIDFIKSLNLNINDEDIIVLDTNLKAETIDYVCSNYKGLKVLDAVSSKKLEKVLNVIPKLDLIKVNLDEYEYVKDIKGLNLLITSGNVVGLLYKEYDLIVKHNYLSLVNPNGCGDTLFGVFISLMDNGIEEALYNAVIAGASASQTEDSVPSLELINKTKGELDIKWIE